MPHGLFRNTGRCFTSVNLTFGPAAGDLKLPRIQLGDAYSYFVPARRGESLFRDRGSKFIGIVLPLRNADEVKPALSAVKKEYPAARHYCYAWRTGPAGTSMRSSDEGEPSGTAGKPILAQIVSAELTNVMVVVVRYFGGTLLGTGGLIQAYKTAAAEALAEAGKEQRFVQAAFTARFSDAEMSGVQRVLKMFDARVLYAGYDTEHIFQFTVKRLDAFQLRAKFADLYRVELTELPVDDEKNETKDLRL